MASTIVRPRIPTAIIAAFAAMIGIPTAGLSVGHAATPKVVPDAAVDMFAAMEAGDVDVKLIVKDIQNARIIAKNNTDKPITLKVPEAFAAIPVLAQGQGGGIGGGGQGGGGGGFFNVPPEKVVKHDLPFVCLEHGTPDPRSTMPYEPKPIEAITTNPQVIELVKQLGYGTYGHKAAQAAAWHLQDGMSWQQLAGKQIRRANGARHPYFTAVEMRQAVNIVTDVARRIERPSETSASLAN